MKATILLIALTICSIDLYSQGTQVGDTSSPVYHYNGSGYPSPIIARSDGDFLFTTGNGSSRNGIISFGATTPDYKLDVLRAIRANEVKVATGWIDFVIEPEYELKSLDQIEEFINENGHLQDIISAEEFKQNGVGLGEMDDMLLRKIEELTLYVIEQNEKLEAQSTKLQELKMNNEKLKSLNSLLNEKIEKLENE